MPSIFRHSDSSIFILNGKSSIPAVAIGGNPLAICFLSCAVSSCFNGFISLSSRGLASIFAPIVFKSSIYLGLTVRRSFIVMIRGCGENQIRFAKRETFLFPQLLSAVLSGHHPLLQIFQESLIFVFLMLLLATLIYCTW